MTALTLDSMRQYEELGVRIECGGIEVARTEERMEELERRMVVGRVVGRRAASSLVTPAEIKELVPVHRRERDHRRLLHARRSSVVDSLRAGTLMREQAPGSRAR